MLESLGRGVHVTIGFAAYAAAVVVAEFAGRRQVKSSHLVLSSLVTWPLVLIVFVEERSVAALAVGWVSRLLGLTEDEGSSAHFQTLNDGLDYDDS